MTQTGESKALPVAPEGVDPVATPSARTLPLTVMDRTDWSHDVRADLVRIGPIEAPRLDWIAALERLAPSPAPQADAETPTPDVDDLLRNFQRACEEVVGGAGGHGPAKERAILRNELRARLLRVGVSQDDERPRLSLPEARRSALDALEGAEQTRGDAAQREADADAAIAMSERPRDEAREDTANG